MRIKTRQFLRRISVRATAFAIIFTMALTSIAGIPTEVFAASGQILTTTLIPSDVKFTATLTSDGDSFVANGTTKDGKTVFSFDVSSGTYQLSITADGYTSYIDTAFVLGEDKLPEKIECYQGDINGDGVIDEKDNSIFVGAYGKRKGDNEYNSSADFNNDKIINVKDKAIMSANFAKQNSGLTDKQGYSDEELDEFISQLDKEAFAQVDKEAKYNEQTESFSFSDSSSPISQVTVNYVLNDAGSVFIKEYSGDRYFQNAPGILGVPVEIDAVGSTVKKAVISFIYDKDIISGTKPGDLGIVWFDEKNDVAVLLDNAIVDEKSSSISVETTHFSSYAVVDTNKWFAKWKEQLPILRNTNDEVNKDVFFNIVLAIDSSGSMQGNRIAMSKEAAKEVVKHLKDNDVLSVVSFGSSAKRVLYRTYIGETTFEDISDTIDSIYASGGTNYVAGLDECLSAINDCGFLRITSPSEADKQHPQTKDIVVFLSDGEAQNTDSEIERVLNKFSNTKIITVGLGYGVSESTLKKVASKTGGDYFFANSADELTPLYNLITGLYIGIDTDTDGDGLPDLVETVGMRTECGDIIKTDPEKADTDGDGYLDGVEMGTYDPDKNLFHTKSNPLIKSVFHDYSMPTDVSSSIVPVCDLTVKKAEDIDFSKFKVSYKLNYVDYETVEKTVISSSGETVSDTKTEHFYKEPSATFTLAMYDDKCMSIVSKDLSKKNEATWIFSCANANKKKSCKSNHKVQVFVNDSAAEKNNTVLSGISDNYDISEIKQIELVRFAERKLEALEKRYEVLPKETPKNGKTTVSPERFANDFRNALAKEANKISNAEKNYVDPAKEKIKETMFVNYLGSSLNASEQKALEDMVLDYVINKLSDESLNQKYSSVFKDWLFDMTSPFETISFESEVIKEVTKLCSNSLDLKGTFTYKGVDYSVTSSNTDMVGAVFGTITLTSKTSTKVYKFEISGAYGEALTVFMAIMNNLHNSVDYTLKDTMSLWRLPGNVSGFLNLWELDEFIKEEIKYTKEMNKFFNKNGFSAAEYRKFVTFSKAKTIFLTFMDKLDVVQKGINASRDKFRGKKFEEVANDVGCDVVLDQVENIEKEMNNAIKKFYTSDIF